MHHNFKDDRKTSSEYRPWVLNNLFFLEMNRTLIWRNLILVSKLCLNLKRGKNEDENKRTKWIDGKSSKRS